MAQAMIQEPRTRRTAEWPFFTVRREMARVLGNLLHGPEMLASAFRGGVCNPSIDVTETDTAITVTAELPGLSGGDIAVSVSDDVLTIKGEKKIEREEKQENRCLAERSYGEFYRLVPLPERVDLNAVTATFKNGLLEIVLAKRADVRRNVRKIEVKAS